MPAPVYSELINTAACVLSAFNRPWPVVPIAVEPAQSLFDIYFGGKGRVYGTVQIDSTPSDVPVARRVRLIRDRDGVCIRETWSNATTGAYEFTYIDERERYTVISYDYVHDYRAVVADNLTPELMT